MTDFFAAHKALLDQALDAIGTRAYWSAYPEMPSGKIYGETAKADGEAAFAALRDKPFSLPGHPGDAGLMGDEVSPYGPGLGIVYPAAQVESLIAAATQASEAWADASVETRTGLCLEIIARLNKQSFLIANAVQHTTGQAFAMAFQAGGPHAQDRALEAVAYAYAEMSRVPGNVTWAKPQGKADPIILDKSFTIVPRGIALTIGCATFPTWNAYPGLFASLVTGNAVIVKPHPGAILPLALTVRIGRAVLSEAGFDPNVLLLAIDTAAKPIAKTLALDPAVAIVDFTGGPAFGQWLRENLRGKLLYTEEAGVNSIVIESCQDFRAMCANIAFSLSLYSGQMCTAPQNIFVPAQGIETAAGPKSFDEVGAGIAAAIDKLLSDPDRAASILGAVQNPVTLSRVATAAGHGKVVRPSSPIALPGFADARSATPLLIALDAANEDVYLREWFGPIAFLISTKDSEDALARASCSALDKGAITAALYSRSDSVIARASKVFGRAGVALSVNLTGGIFVNQSAAFSDFHVSGANPAGNACLTDAAFVANRFRIAARRIQKAA